MHKLWTVWALAMVGCAEPRTPAEQCRLNAAMAHVARSQHPDATADSLEQLRCDEMAREESRNNAAAASEKAALAAQAEQISQQTRSAPHSPELGATNAEVKAICTRQGGVQDGDTCSVGGAPVFVAQLSDSRVVRVETYFEGGDLSAARARAEERFGPPTGETVSPDGYRVFSWRDGALTMGMYAKGYRIAISRHPTPPQSTESPPVQRP